MSTETFVFDPFAPGYTDDPYPEYARLRADGPAHEHPLGFWVVSHHRRKGAATHAVELAAALRERDWITPAATRGARPYRAASVVEATA